MSEAHFDEFEHYNFDQDKAMRSGHSGKWNFLESFHNFRTPNIQELLLTSFRQKEPIGIREHKTMSIHRDHDHDEQKLHLIQIFRKAANKEGGVDEHQQAQPRGAREEDRDEADERREEQLEPGSGARGGQLKTLNLSQH